MQIGGPLSCSFGFQAWLAESPAVFGVCFGRWKSHDHLEGHYDCEKEFDEFHNVWTWLSAIDGVLDGEIMLK